jgi:hypothetical protein
MYDGSVVFVGAVGACEGGCDVKSLWGFSVGGLTEKSSTDILRSTAASIEVSRAAFGSSRTTSRGSIPRALHDVVHLVLCEGLRCFSSSETLVDVKKDFHHRVHALICFNLGGADFFS